MHFVHAASRLAAPRGACVPLVLALACCWLLAPVSPASAQSELDALRLLRHIEADESGPEGAPGLPLPPLSGVRLLQDSPLPGTATVLVRSGGDEQEATIEIELSDPIHFTLSGGEGGTYRLFLLDPEAGELIEVRVERTAGKPKFRSFDVSDARLLEPAGMAFHPAAEDLLVLDAARGALVRLMGPDFARSKELPLPQGLALRSDLRGLGLDPTSGHLYLLSPSAAEIYELSASGALLSLRSLSELGAFHLLATTFAASWDSTDDPDRVHLYLASSDPAGVPQVSEWTFAPPVTNQPRANQPATLEQTLGAQSSWSGPVSSLGSASNLNQTIDTSSFIPPSPDAAGIAYQPGSDSFLMTDSEVSEMPLYQGVNVFEHDRFGNVLETFDTTHFSDEPTGVAIDPASGQCFFSDDTGTRSVYVVDPGPDGTCLTSDDGVSSFRTKIFGSNDPEGLAFCQGLLFVVDGANEEYYEIDPGPNRIFDGVPPDGDDRVASCDTSAMGVQDPEGITCDESTGQLYLVGKPEGWVTQATRSCEIVSKIDVSVADARKPSGLALGPSSVFPGLKSLWITDRGTDNNTDPNENDGRVYEMSLPTITPGNSAPVVHAGPDQAITLPENALLQGSVGDDGIPGPVSSQWTQTGGPGSVSFSDASRPVTSASFSAAGAYTLLLTASDGELISADELGVNVATADGALVLDLRVQDGFDDAEEATDDGGISRISSDLELGGSQTVGIRFSDVGISPGATIVESWLQFSVDEASLSEAVLTIEGDAAPTAAPFLTTPFDISSRLRTGTRVDWEPPPWPTPGDEGADQRTPDLSPILQELVDQDGWASGNAMAFILTGTGLRIAESANGSPSHAPLLHVVHRSTNTPPVVTITAPADGTAVAEPSWIGLEARASDEDGDLSSSIVWSSSLEGDLGSGASLWTQLGVGTHTITAVVSDSGGLSGEDRISVTVSANATPAVAISSPGDGTTTDVGSPVSFGASASDAEDGDLSAALSWFSNRDGLLGGGASFTTSTLSVGTHVVTASVTDGLGASGTDAITLVVNGPPVVAITAPADGTSVAEGTSVVFRGSASDEDGNLSSELGWSSSLDGFLGTGASLGTASLSPGTHVVTAQVGDGRGLTGSDQLSVTVRANAAPSVSIAAPVDGTTTDAGSPVTFAGTASDPEQGDLSSGLAWSSDRDGPLGSGALFVTSGLSAGVHGITAEVSDALGAHGSRTITLSVNGPPLVTITAPAEGTSITEGILVVFTGSASDEDGDLSSGLRWSSSRDGVLGTGASISSSSLSPGTHRITARVSDGRGLSGSDEISLTVGTNATPTVAISSPGDGTTTDVGSPVSFGGSASDAEDGDLSAALSWSSNRDGLLGGGASFTTSTLSVGTHVVTASVTDGLGASGTDAITVVVNGPPVVAVTAPADGTSVAEGTSVVFMGSASDEDGNLSSELRWSSSLDGFLGTGASLGTASLSPGTHGITAQVSDGRGLTGSRTISLTVNGTPVLAITAPADGTTIDAGSRLTFAGTASDAEEGDLSSGISWSSSRDGALGSGASLETSGLSVGTHVVTASVTDSLGATSTEAITLSVNGPPVVAITAPADGTTVDVGRPVILSGTASDPEQGDLSPSISWSSSRDGTLGSGASLSIASLSVGVHQISAQITDSRGLTATDRISMSVSSGEELIFEARVASSEDDAEERQDGSLSLTSVDLELVHDQGGNQVVGMRFQGVPIPRGASIVTAHVQFQADEVTSEATALTLRGHASDDAPAFADAPADISSRPTTDAAVAWSPPAWLAKGDTGPAQRTPNLARVIQEIVNRSGWRAGSALALLVSGSGARIAESYEGKPTAAPLLRVEYDLGGNQFPLVDAGPDQTFALPQQAASLLGSVTDDGLPDPPGGVSVTWSQVEGPLGVIFEDASDPATTASLPGAGSYVLRLTGHDGQLAAHDDVTITVLDPAVPAVLESRVAASSDDAEETSSGHMRIGSGDLELVLDKGEEQLVGLRFQGIAIPRGASISRAYLQFEVDEAASIATALLIHGQATDDAPGFSSLDGNLSSRSLTTAASAWSPPSWPVPGAAGPDQRSSDLAAVIQEIVDRPGWSAGHSLVLVVSGTGQRIAESFDGKPSGAPLLHVEYQLP